MLTITSCHSEWWFRCTLFCVQLFALRVSSHCKHDMGAVSWLNAETVEKAPTPLFGRLVRCPTHGPFFRRLRYIKPKYAQEIKPKKSSQSLPKKSSQSLPKKSSQSLPKNSSQSLPKKSSQSMPKKSSQSMPQNDQSQNSPNLRNLELRLNQLKWRRRQSDTNTGYMKKYLMIIMRPL